MLRRSSDGHFTVVDVKKVTFCGYSVASERIRAASPATCTARQAPRPDAAGDGLLGTLDGRGQTAALERLLGGLRNHATASAARGRCTTTATGEEPASARASAAVPGRSPAAGRGEGRASRPST